MTFLTGSALMAPPPQTYPDAINSEASIFNIPITENHASHPFDTSQRLSLWGDWWRHREPLRSCFLLSKLCKGKAHERELQLFLLQSPQSYLHIGGICFDLAHCPELIQTSDKNAFPECVRSHSARAHCALAVMRILQRFFWIIMKIRSQRLMRK